MEDLKKIYKAWENLEESFKRDAKKKLLKEDAAVAAGAGDMVNTGDIAQYKEKFGAKPKKVTEDLKTDAELAAKKSVVDVKSGNADQSDATVVAQLAKENEIPGMEPEATDPSLEAPVDAPVEETQDLISKLQAKFPGAVITVSIKVPETSPIDTNVVASAQEVTSAETTPVDATQDVEQLAESRQFKINEARKRIQKLFKEADEMNLDGSSEPAPEEAPIDGASPEAAPEEAPVEPATVVTDTEIALTPEQWEQVLVTDEVASDVPGSEGDMAPESSEQEMPVA